MSRQNECTDTCLNSRENLRPKYLILSVRTFTISNLVFKTSLFATIYKEGRNKIGEHVWVGYRRNRKYAEMVNTYDKNSFQILSHQRHPGQQCGAYNPFYKSFSLFDFYCDSWVARNDHYLTLCLIPDDL